MFLHIFQIQFDLLLHDDLNVILLWILSLLHQFILIPELNGSRIGDTRTDIKHMHLLRGPVIYIVTNFWSRTDKAHVADEDIYQLRELVNLEFPDSITGASDARVTTGDGNERALVRTDSH